MKFKNAILSLSLFAAGTLGATTIYPEQVKCGNCGAENEVTVVGSTNQMQYPDLDLRPGEMARSTLPYQVAECKKCHYCAPDIAAKPKSEAAKKAIAQPMPGDGLADRFARAGEIIRAEAEANSGDAEKTAMRYLHSGMFFLRAAWACDDDGKQAEAVKYRRLSATELEKTLALCDKARSVGEWRTAILLVLSDACRRAGDFERAEKAAKQVPSDRKQERAIADFQLELCRKKDTGRHTLGEVPGFAK